jgi:hypothetical protein
VHTDCGAAQHPDKPNGWVREINKDGSVGDNLEAKQDFLLALAELADMA